MKSITPTIQIKRAQESPSPNDGGRVLVDRLWPRGISKERAKLDAWMKELAPSTELRKWFGHDPARWAKFKTRYERELKPQNEGIRELMQKAKGGVLTLIYAAKDEQHNNAVVLKDYIEAMR